MICGPNFNNTNVVVLLTGLITYEKADDVWNVCIDAYTFSFDTLQWNDVKECFIKSKNIYGLYNYLTSTTYFDRFSRLYVDIFFTFTDTNTIYLL